MVMNELKTLLQKALKELLPSGRIDFSVEVPQDTTHGDYSSNIAMAMFRVFAKSVEGHVGEVSFATTQNQQRHWKNPQELAKTFVEKLLEEKPDWIEKIEVAGPGFINFFISRVYLLENTKKTHEKEYGVSNILSGKKILTEYTDANPFKEMHIGHLMSNAIGESVSRLLSANGAEVKRSTYQGDVGMHIAMAIWSMKNNNTSLWEAYADGVKHAKENEEVTQNVKEINKKIYEKSDDEINSLYEKGRKESLEKFEEIYKRIGTHFDFYFFESEVAPIGLALVEKNKELFEEGEGGAVVYKGEEKGLHTRVFVNSEGLPTYEVKELGLFKEKLNRWNPDTLVVLTGNEITEYFKVVKSAASEIYELKDIAENTHHIGHGMLRLSTGKMSSRTGNVITAESLLNDVSEKLKDRINDEQLRDDVAVSAVKYSMLKQEARKDIVFDFEKSLSFTGDSGPYLQYTHARCKSLLAKGGEEGITPSEKVPTDTTLSIERTLLHFPEVIEKAGKEHAPHHLCSYLRELAATFNSFYGEGAIVEKGNEESVYKLFVVAATANVLAEGLSLLGIQAPDKM